MKQSKVLSPAARQSTLGVSLALLLVSPVAAEIKVQVNGNPVQFAGTQPAQISGRIFIPLRAVVESLGAEIKWEPSTQTVRGQKGEQEFSLQIGSRDATVNGKAVRLDVPAQLISGATMVPLRFVAEALGAEVEWNAAQQMVLVNAADGAVPAAGDRISGEVVSVQATGVRKTITVRANGVRQTYELTQDTVILRGEVGKRGAQVELDELQPGDQVKLRVNADRGTADLVDASFPTPKPVPGGVVGDVIGEIVAIENLGNRRSVTVRTPTGRTTYDVPVDALISRNREGRITRGDLEDVQVGDRVKLSLDRAGRFARSIEAGDIAPAGGNPGGDPVRPGTRVTGTIVAIRAEANPPVLVVRNGNSRVAYEISPDSVIFRSIGTGRGTRSTLDDLVPGDQVTVRVDRTGTMAEVVEAKGVADVVDNLPQPAADLRINAFSHDAQDVLRSGSTVRVTLTGTPGAIATFDVGSVAKGVAMREDVQRPGRYTGSYLIPKGTTAKEVPILAQLRTGNKVSQLIQAATELTIDSEAPQVSGLAPADKGETSNQQPDIYVEISDGAGSGIDMESVKLTVRDKDVSDLVKVTPRFLLYTPRAGLTPGAVPVTLTLRDKAGNETTTNWNFTVRPASQVLQSVTHDGDHALRAGDVLTVTVKAATRGRGTFSIGDQVRNVPLEETTVAGTYRGRYTVKEGDQLVKAPITVDFTSREGDRVRSEATAPVNVLTRKLAAPTITSPLRRFALGEELVVEGTAPAGTKVKVEVTFTGRAFGALPVKGTFGSQEVVADRTGRWVSAPFRSTLPLGVRRPELTLTASSSDVSGEQSEPAVITIPTR